jgi:monoamine oxidase
MNFFDVVIVGGGLTGLSAAETISKNSSLNILLLEAQDCFGGRTCTVHSHIQPDCTVDLGGQWVGPIHSKLLGILERFGIEKLDQEFSPSLNLNGTSKPRLVEMINVMIAPLTDEEQLEIEMMEDYIEDLCRSMDLNKPWTLIDADELDSMTVKEYVEKRLKHSGSRSEVILFCEVVLSCDPAKCSFLFFIFFLASSGGMKSIGDGPDGMQKWRLQGGSQQISERYAEEITRLGVITHTASPVLKISKESDNFIIDYGENESIYQVACKSVMLAMSPILALRSIDLSDLISADDVSSYSTMIPGKAVKIILVYKEDFWMTAVKNDDRPIITVHQLSNYLVQNLFPCQVGVYPALVALITGTAAEKFTMLSEQKGQAYARMEVFKQLTEVYGCSIEISSNPLEVFERNWSTEKYANGCYAGYYPPGVLTRHGKQPSTKEEGLYWASTETASKFYGYMEGALRAGERAAHDLIDDLQPNIT